MCLENKITGCKLTQLAEGRAALSPTEETQGTSCLCSEQGWPGCWWRQAPGKTECSDHVSGRTQWSKRLLLINGEELVAGDKPDEDPQMGPGPLNIDSLPTLTFPASRVHFPQQTTLTPPSLRGQVNPTLPRPGSRTHTSFSGALGWVVCQGSGLGVLSSESLL